METSGSSTSLRTWPTRRSSSATSAAMAAIASTTRRRSKVSRRSHSRADQDALFTETIARHFPEARLADGDIELGFAHLRLRWWVDNIMAMGRCQSASLFLNLSGGALGPSPVFASISGYAESAERAIVTGACN